MKKTTAEKTFKKTKSKEKAKLKRKAFLFSEEAEWLWDCGDEKARIMSADFRQVTSARSHHSK
jgi:hypothetical protein